jgi:lipopolysaccharide transport system ATP-binding protein
MTPAIQVEHLAKSYRISHAAERGQYKTLRESLSRVAAKAFKRRRNAGTEEEFWALKDVSFDVQPGEVVGIIGRNGAGKSTLLKILSRITKPTRGEVTLNGRIGSLLEVGTGFHPELTGRENIYLNGSILGMRRGDIERQFDAVVDFSGVENFLDTPVKRYSSGMYVRLAFAVAAHLEPEILLVDEVLAVGDAQFQAKCIARMGEVAREGRSVLLVSHNMAAVSNLCSRAIVISNGTLEVAAGTDQAIAHYMSSGTTSNVASGDALERCRPNWAQALIKSVRVTDEQGNDCGRFPLAANLQFELTFESQAPEGILLEPVMGIVINHSTLGAIGGVNTRMTGFQTGEQPARAGRIRGTILRPPLLQGTYSVDFWLGDGAVDIDVVQNAITFEIEATDLYRTGSVPLRHLGAVFLDASWEMTPS